MSRLILLSCALVVLLSACRNEYSISELEAEARKPHSIKELLIWHDDVVAVERKDFFFTLPIGRHGKDGVEATLTHIQNREKRSYSNADLALFLDVARHAEAETDYVMCADVSIQKRISQLSARNRSEAKRLEGFRDSVRYYCSRTLSFQKQQQVQEAVSKEPGLRRGISCRSLGK